MAHPLKPRPDGLTLWLFYLAMAVVLGVTLVPRGLFAIGAAALVP